MKILTKKFKTNDPFVIAENLNIIVIIRYIHPEINGFYKLEQRNKFIFINKYLSTELQKFVCAHELGHAILHPKSNTPFLRRNTLYSVDRIEVEANTFATELLIPDRIGCETIYEAAAIYGVPKNLAYLKIYCNKEN